MVNRSIMGHARAGLLLASAFLAACGAESTAPMAAPGGEQPSAPSQSATVNLIASSTSAAPGERFAVAIEAAAPGDLRLGSLQGELRFNAAKVRYVGQAKPASGEFAMVNGTVASEGRLPIASLNAHGLGRQAAVLVFESRSADYAPTFSFKFGTAGTVQSVNLYRATVSPRLTAGSVAIPSDASQLGVAEWNAIMGRNPAAGNKPSFVPGDIGVLNLKFGDVNLDGTADINDALDIALYTVGLQQLITGTNAPAKDVVVAGNVNPANLPGLGGAGDAIPPGLISGSQTNTDNRTVDINDALDIALFTVGLGSSTVVGQAIPGRGPAATNRITVSCPITTNQNWTKANIYELTPAPTQLDVCLVQTGVTVTIGEGTRIESDNNTLYFERGAQIQANGTLLEPIVMTCTATAASATGVTQNGGPRAPGCWGGVYLNGRASINNGTATSPDGGCLETQSEGTPSNTVDYRYGGCNNADNSGTMRFVVIQNAGTRFSATNERNGLTLQGVGSGTVIDYIQSDNGLDDGVEFFGGTVNVKHMLITRTQDDAFDWVAGWSGNAQFVIVRSCAGGCDNGIEADNFGIDAGDPNATPKSNPTLYNFTLVGIPTPSGTATTGAAMLLRQNTNGTLRNFLIANWKRAALDIDQPNTNRVTSQDICAQIGAGTLSVKNVVTTGNVANGDPDGWTISAGAFTNEGDPIQPYTAPTSPGTGGTATAGTCGGIPVNATRSDLEANYIAAAGNDWTVSGSAILANPFGGWEPSGSTANNFAPADYSPIGAGVATGATPPGGFFDASATYIGAVGGGVPWYAGWTLPRTSN